MHSRCNIRITSRMRLIKNYKLTLRKQFVSTIESLFLKRSTKFLQYRSSLSKPSATYNSNITASWGLLNYNIMNEDTLGDTICIIGYVTIILGKTMKCN